MAKIKKKIVSSSEDPLKLKEENQNLRLQLQVSDLGYRQQRLMQEDRKVKVLEELKLQISSLCQLEKERNDLLEVEEAEEDSDEEDKEDDEDEGSSEIPRVK